MNVLYLLKILNTNKLSELVGVIDLAPLDMNLALWGAVDRGEIELNYAKDKVKALKEPEPWQDSDLASKIIKTIQHYAKEEKNLTLGRLNSQMRDPASGAGYANHVYVMTLHSLIDDGTIVEEVVTIPKTPKRPYKKFIFLCLPGNPNEEWNARTVNKWISEFQESKVK